MLTDKYTRPRDLHGFEIAIFCALRLEADAMIALFDDIWEQEGQYKKGTGDTNTYTFGRIHEHPVVLVHMPRMGKASASSVAASLRSSFPYIRVGFLVGICGGVPFSGCGKQEIILGDVLISTHIVPFDFGRLYPHTFLRKNSLLDNLGRPSPEIGGFLSKLQGQAAQTGVKDSMRADLTLSEYPGTGKDKLFEAGYIHKHADTTMRTVCAQCTHSKDDVCAEALNSSCADLGCDLSRLVPRARIQTMNMKGYSASSYCPAIHFGGLASGDQVIKSAFHRDHIAKQEGVIGFEMEGAGLWDTIPTIVVKGVCDYADSHKGKDWQTYAAAAAAACAKGILNIWRGSARQMEDRSDEKQSAPSPTHQIFSGNFTAGRNIYNGGTFTAKSITF
ncbi:Nucleoside phosphorylase [Penicillium camemberti]|uniref:Nucleoside phosphorylase n=1 Tax=Penicillium camemberti (strain FM 013) TaxID=1429867 RepID=A0A0G4PG73_PENC3|nr:Nucleoside phosphorylase [Penicillium camemberti]